MEALDGAWNDALAQTLAISEISCEEWGQMDFDQQRAAITFALSGELPSLSDLSPDTQMEWLAGSDLPEIVDARELVKAQERNLSNYTDPNQVYETGSDDTFWNSKVIRIGERFNVQVFDADGDRRLDREDSFADQALAIAFAGKSVQRYSGR